MYLHSRDYLLYGTWLWIIGSCCLVFVYRSLSLAEECWERPVWKNNILPISYPQTSNAVNENMPSTLPTYIIMSCFLLPPLDKAAVPRPRSEVQWSYLRQKQKWFSVCCLDKSGDFRAKGNLVVRTKRTESGYMSTKPSNYFC